MAIETFSKFADLLIAVITILLGIIAGFSIKSNKNLQQFITQNSDAHERLASAFSQLDGKVTGLKEYEVAGIERRVMANEEDIDVMTDRIAEHELRISGIEMKEKYAKDIKTGD